MTSQYPSIERRCEIHAEKMQEEGWYVTANVLAAAAEEIKALRKEVEAGSRHAAYINKCVEEVGNYKP